MRMLGRISVHNTNTATKTIERSISTTIRKL